MPKFYPLQSRFNGGELSPRLYGQANTERYQTSLESMSNYIALPQGPAMRRQGFAYVADALNTTDVRLLPFRVPGSTDYCVELGPSYISILSRSNGREVFTTDSLMKNGDFAEGLLHWDPTSGEDFFITTSKDLKRVNFNASFSPTPGIIDPFLSQTIVTGAITDIDLSFTWGGLFNVDPDTGVPGVQVLSMDIRVGTTLGGDELYSASFNPSEGGTVVDAENFGGPPQSGGPAFNIRKFGSNRETVNIATGAADPIFIELKLNQISGIPNGFVLGFFDDIQISSDTVTSETFVTPWEQESDLALIQYVAESGGNRMYFTHPNFPPQLLELDSGSWSFGPVVFVMPPSSWAADNWPSVVEFFQGRLWLAATPSDQSTIWASKSGDPFDFTIGTADDDSMELPLSTTGGIKWMKGQKGMIVGTDIGEQLISSVGSLITPTDRKATKQSGWGSVDIQPSLAGNDIVYISQDRTKVRAINSDLTSGTTWVSVDLTWVAEHLTRNRIIESIYIQNPNYQLYFLLADGTIVACTYDREHSIVGWMRLITDGQFRSLTKTDSVAGTILWTAVRRNNSIYIEVIDPEESIWQFTDSWLQQPINNKVVTGLDHLEGLTVQVIVDGALEPDKTVEGGQITTELGGQFAVVGLEYEASMTTLPLGQGNPAGTALGSLRRYSRIFVQLFDSALPRINGQLPPDRKPATPMNTVEPNLTGDVDVRDLGRNRGGRVTITQNLPKKTMVTAIYGKADQEQT